MSTVLSDFKKFTGELQTLAGCLTGGAIVSPLIGSFAGVSPPWPSGPTSAIFASIAECMVLMLVYEFWWRGRISIKKLRRHFVRFLIATVVMLFVYIGLVNYFVVDVTHEHQVVVGYTYLTPHLADMVREKGYNARELLMMFQGDPKAIWTTMSVSVMEYIVLVTWTLFWSALAAVCSVFIVLQSRHRK